MSNSTNPEKREYREFTEILADVPVDDLDTPEVRGGLTWRQTILQAVTASLLALPTHMVEAHHPIRIALKQRVYERVREHYGDSYPADATDLVLMALEFAEEEYAELAAENPEWQYEHQLVGEVLTQWGDDFAYSNELLASNVLWYLNYDSLVQI